ERRVIQKTAIQRAISSMLGLVFPTCGCPKTAYMRPMARFHLPLATEEETVFRVTGTYLLAQYFLNEKGKKGQFDFSGLTKIYEDLHILNTAIASRLKTATKSDSSKNAITLLDMYATLVPMLIEDQLVEIRGFFQAYLPEDDIEPVATKHNYLEKAKAFSLELELVPIEGDKKDDIPDWMKEVRGEKTDAPEAKKASFSLPDDEETTGNNKNTEKDEEEPSFSFSLADYEEPSAQKTTGKASYQLADDEPPPVSGKASFQLPENQDARPKPQKASFSLPGDDTDEEENAGKDEHKKEQDPGVIDFKLD
ncbi:MAG: hypothetical protein KDI30_05310, partial [Pseudomonadales bacterium]|nr:hypothetical protein [Pseudomonadales bacterium]